MSKDMPYYSIDKVSATVSIDAKARAKWDARSKKSGIPPTTLMAMFLEREVRDDPFTVEDLERANQYMQNNVERREKRKERKGKK